GEAAEIRGEHPVPSGRKPRQVSCPGMRGLWEAVQEDHEGCVVGSVGEGGERVSVAFEGDWSHGPGLYLHTVRRSTVIGRDVEAAKEHRTRPEHGEETRARLVTIATELFATAGYNAVSLEQVCLRAGVTRGALYHHFPGKEGLFRAVCDEVAADLSARVA